MLSAHVGVHKGEFVCQNSSCKKGFTTSMKLELHKSVHLNLNNLFDCDYCSDVFGDKIKFEEHLLTHKQLSTKSFLCQSCGKYFLTKVTFNRHLRRVHNNMQFKCKVSLLIDLYILFIQFT